MAERKFVGKELEEFRDKVLELRVQGHTQRQIADALDVTQQNVSHHLKQIFEQKDIARDVNIELLRDLQVLSAEQKKVEIWKVIKCSTDPLLKLRALATMGQADDQIIKLYHLDKIPPLVAPEDDLMNKTNEAIALALTEILSPTNDAHERMDEDPELNSLLSAEAYDGPNLKELCNPSSEAPGPSRSTVQKKRKGGIAMKTSPGKAETSKE